MPIEKQEFINVFSKQTLDNRTSLFLGAGSSCDAGYPTWDALFRPLLEELQINENEVLDYYSLAQYYSNKFGRSELKKRINSSINKYDFESPLLDKLLNLDFSNVWTTNFDNVIEENYKKRNVLVNKIFQDEDLANLELNKHLNIFKMNGDISNLENIIATKSEFEKYHDLRKLMLMFFKRELISSTFLFIGYSFTDNLVLDCINELSKYLGETTTYHYTIMKNDKSNPYFIHFINDLESRYYIKVLLVDDYSDIPNIISEINKKIQAKKVFISGAFKSYEPSIENFSHELSQKLSEALLKKDYRIVNSIGRRFGTHLIGYANEFLIKSNIQNIERHLIIHPFVGNKEDSLQKKKFNRQNIIERCGAAIFVFGDAPKDNKFPSGVLEEFDIARELNKVVIPISYSGMVSEQIWNKIKENITQFPYLENKLDNLTSETPIHLIVETIIQILKETRCNL